MIVAWRKIDKVCGFVQAERITVEVNAAGSLEMGRLNQLSDAELLKIIGAGQSEQRGFDQVTV